MDRNISLFEIHTYWYKLSPRVWQALGAGYIIVTLCIVAQWNVDKAGGVLAGLSIAAQMFLLSSPLQQVMNNNYREPLIWEVRDGRWQFETNLDDDYKHALVKFPGEKGVKSVLINMDTDIRISILGTPDVAARDEELHIDDISNTMKWDHIATYIRINGRVNNIIGYSMITGTFIWAIFG